MKKKQLAKFIESEVRKQVKEKRQIRGGKYDVESLVRNAMLSVRVTSHDKEDAIKALQRLGHRNPSPSLVEKYARETNILKSLERKTGARFTGQLGKIDFSSHASAVRGVNAYLTRRFKGHQARWGQTHRN